ncbi:MAG: Fic family protein [Anaerolineales bacterium]
MNAEDFKDSQTGSVQKTPKGYWAFIPNPLPTSLRIGPDLVQALSMADRSVGELAGIGRTIPNPHLLIVPFIRREAVLSSRIEGTLASLSDLYAYEAQQLELLERPPDVKEVHNYVVALEYGTERLRTLPPSLRFIRELHAKLMAGVRGEHGTPGEFRRSQNWIGPPGSTLEDATFVPPPIEEMGEALAELEEYLHTSPELPPLVRLALIHYQFEAIHPFLDGNGRVGRLLIALMLRAWGILPEHLLYLSAYFVAHRQQYYDLLLSLSQRGKWDEWLRFFLDGIHIQARDSITRANRLVLLRRDFRERTEGHGAARLFQVIEHLFERPIVSVNQLAQSLDMNYQMANRYIQRLEDLGILSEVTGQSRNRLFAASEILKVLEEEEPLVEEPEIDVLSETG